MINALWKFRRDTKAAMALIEITRSSNILIVGGKGPVVFAAGSTIAAWTFTFFQLVTRTHDNQRAGQIFRIAVPLVGIDRKAVGGPTQMSHFGAIITQFANQTCWQSMIMIDASRLDMSVVLIKPQINLAALRIVIPRAVTIPKLSRPSLKRHPVHRHPKQGMKRWDGFLLELRIQSHLKLIFLRGNRMRVPLIWKLPRFMIRHAVGLNDALAIFFSDADTRCLQGKRKKS